MGFREGALAFEEREERGFRDLQKISGQFPTSYGQPGGSWAPQAFPVLKKWGIPTYLDSHDILSVDEKPFRYGGILNLTRLKHTLRVRFHEKGVEEAKSAFRKVLEEDGDFQFVSIYYHPCEFACSEFWDGVNFRRGKNTPREEWKGAPLRTKEDMLRWIGMLEEFLRWTLTIPGVEYITAAESCLYEKYDPSPVTAEELRSIALSLPDGPDYSVRGSRSLCASELLSLFSRRILGLHLTPEFFYGPEADLPSNIVTELTPGELARAALEQFECVLGYKQLPELYRIRENTLNPIDLFCALRDAAAAEMPADQPMKIQTGKGRLCPARHVKEDHNWSGWIIFPEDMDAPGIVRQAKLQTWTLKPAVF